MSLDDLQRLGFLRPEEQWSEAFVAAQVDLGELKSAAVMLAKLAKMADKRGDKAEAENRVQRALALYEKGKVKDGIAWGQTNLAAFATLEPTNSSKETGLAREAARRNLRR